VESWTVVPSDLIDVIVGKKVAEMIVPSKTTSAEIVREAGSLNAEASQGLVIGVTTAATLTDTDVIIIIIVNILIIHSKNL